MKLTTKPVKTQVNLLDFLLKLEFKIDEARKYWPTV